MKPIIIRENSWHYKLANTFSNGSIRDICEYTSGLIKGCITSLVILCAAGLLLIPSTFAVLSLFSMYIKVNFHKLVTIGLVEWVIYVILAIVMGMVFLITWLKVRNRNNYKGPNVFVESFRSWKGKYCTPVRVLDKNGNWYDYNQHQWIQPDGTPFDGIDIVVGYEDTNVNSTGGTNEKTE